MTPKLRRMKAAAEREHQRRLKEEDSGAPRWSLEAFAGGHEAQLAALRDRSNWIHLICDRQSGKTQTDLGIMADNAQEHAGSLNVFLGLVGTGLEISVWPAWKAICDKYAIERSDNETLRISYFPNGSLAVFGGTDDLKNIKKYLGNRLHNGVFIIDEAQDQKSSILRYLLEQLLPPMCTPTTRVIQSGVLPDLPVGYFLDCAKYDQASQTGGKSAKWSHHSWGRLANPHTPEAAQQLAALEAEKGSDDPQLLRDWKGCQRVWDPGATAFRYVAARDAWTGTPAPWLADLVVAPGELYPFPPGKLLAVVPPPGVDMFSIGLDPAATADRFAIVLWGWSRTQRLGLWHIAEWVTERGANALESQYLEVIKQLKQRYASYGPVVRVIRDAGSSSTTNDILWRNHAIMIEPAIKGPGSRKARVDRLADVLGTSQGHILAGSELENDLKLAKWDKDARAEFRYEWDSSHHPDVGDAATYGAVAFYESAPPAPAPALPEIKAAAAEAEEAIRQRFAAPPPARQRPRDSASIWGVGGRRW